MTTTPVSSRKSKDSLSPLIADPLEYDVVCAKDHFYARHTGNLLFRDRIEATKNTYRKARTKQEKKKVTKDFVNYLQSKHGSRFLKRRGNDWVEISELQARDKVSHALRFATRQRHGKGDKEGETKTNATSNIRPDGALSNSGYSSDMSPSQSCLTVVDILDEIFKRQQQLLRCMQEGNGDEILPNKSSSTPVLDSSSNKSPARHGSFICFEQKVKSSVVDPPALRSLLSDVLFSEPLNTSQLECQNQQQPTTIEPAGSSKHTRTSMCFASQQEELTLEEN